VIGRTLGHYEILGPLGKGGMGEVYRARDTSLKREVAIKLLPEDLATDPERLARLEREAHLLAALNHPNIATIHALEEDQGTRFLVLELVQGESLEQRLATGSLPVEKGLELCKQIADALEAAHGEGISHRDLKPANVLVTPEGRAKVLDFGLAKPTASTGADTEIDMSHSPTVTVAGTQAGVILGTAPYMSPEQVRGDAVDKRADIWAFGCVLYEVLIGRRAFHRGTVADTLAAIIEAEPDWDGLPTTTPALVVALLRRCLRKDPHLRLHDIADARIEIDEALGEPAVATVAHQPRPGSISFGWAIPLTLAALMVGALLATSLGGAVFGWGNRNSDAPVTNRFPLDGIVSRGWSGGIHGSSAIAVSPDGRRIAFTGQYVAPHLVDVSPPPGNQLWVWNLDSLDSAAPTAVPGTDGAQGPVFSPDGESLAFWRGRKLLRVPVGGGAPEELYAADPEGEFLTGGISWGTDESMVFAAFGSIYRLAPGQRMEAELLHTGETAPWPAVRAPQLLPGNRTLIFIQCDIRLDVPSSTGIVCDGSVMLKHIGNDEAPIDLGIEAHSARYAGGHLLLSRDRELWAVGFDPGSGRVTGSERRIAVDLRADGDGVGSVDVSENGTLVWMQGGEGTRELVWWRHREEQAVETILTSDDLDYEFPRLFEGLRVSPSGDKIAFTAGINASHEIWTHNLNSGVNQSLARTSGWDAWPVWSPGSDRIAYTSFVGAKQGGVYEVGLDGSDPVLLYSPPGPEVSQAIPTSWSDDGRYIAITEVILGAPGRILLLDKEEGNRIEPVTEGAHARFHPSDSNWLLYQVLRDGAYEVWLSDRSGSRSRKVSSGGGTWPVWSPNNNEFFYTGEGSVWVVPYTKGVDIVPGQPVRSGRGGGMSNDTHAADYDIHPDGDLVLMEVSGPRIRRSRTWVVFNLFEELEDPVPTGGR